MATVPSAPVSSALVPSALVPSALVPSALVPASTPLDAHRRRTFAVPPAAPRPGTRVLLCHPALLTGQAIAATLRARHGITDVTVVGSANDLVREIPRRSAVALVSETLGTDLPELLQALAFRGLASPVVVMSTDADPDLTAQYLEWGAAGSVDVRRPVSALVEAIAVATAGAPVVDDLVRAEVVHRLDDRAAQREHARQVLQALSARERAVLESLAGGTGVVEIARTLHLSPHTIRACIRTLGPKLQVNGQLRIAAVARELLRAAQAPAPTRYLSRLSAEGRAALSLSG